MKKRIIALLLACAVLLSLLPAAVLAAKGEFITTVAKYISSVGNAWSNQRLNLGCVS